MFLTKHQVLMPMLLAQELHLEIDQYILTVLKAKKIEVIGYCKKRKTKVKTILRSIKGFDEQTPRCYF